MSRSPFWLLLLALCACHRVSEADARDFIKTTTAAAGVDNEDDRFRVLLQGCSEIPSCAAGCEKALSAAASVDRSDRGTLLAHCFDDAKAAKAADPKLTIETWYRGYLSKYAARARETLPQDARKALDEPLAKLKL